MPIVLKKPAGTAGSSWPAIAVGLFVAFGGVLFGYEAGFARRALRTLRD